jgi:transcriptional regulator GlxA family with amidase domain
MQRVGFVVSPGFQVMSIAALGAFEFANSSVEKPVYDIRVLSEAGGRVRSSLGLAIETRRFGSSTFDTVIVSGSIDIVPASRAVLAFLRKAAKRSRRVASICTGAFILAEAGLLDGRRATTHWCAALDLRSHYPNVKVNEDRIFIVDPPIWTSAGASAGVDLALAMIEEDLGVELARLVAKKLVLYHRRGGGQSQHSVLLEMDAKPDRIQSVLTYAKRNLRASLSVERLAKVAHLSPRQFSRAFQAATGRSPAKAIESLRVEAARVMLEQGHDSIDDVARESGFTSRDHMRRAFLRAHGQPPQALRRASARPGPSGSTDD